MRIADREQCAVDFDRIVHHRASADAPIVDVAAVLSRRDRAHSALGVGRYAGGSQMRPYRHAGARKRGLAISGLWIADPAPRQGFFRIIGSEKDFGLPAV